MALTHLKTLFLLVFALQITTLLYSQTTDSIRVVPLRERGPEYPDGQASLVDALSSLAVGPGLVTVYVKVELTVPPLPSLAVTVTG